MFIVFNKVTWEWGTVENTGELSSDWIVDPTFDDRERADFLGPKYWTYSGNNVHALTDEEINSNSTFLAEAIYSKKKEVNVFREEYMTDYFTYDNKQWDCDDQALTNIIGLILMGLISGNSLPSGTIFRDHNNTNHEVTFTYMVYMAITLMQFKSAVYATSWTHKAAIDALATIDEVSSYDITTGWPAK